MPLSFIRLWAIPIASALILALCVAHASANRLSISERSFRIRWTALRLIAGGNTTTCAVTLEGSFHSATMRKIERLLAGHITRASIASCSGGSATILRETLPWHVQYAGFTGRLPAISTIKLLIIGWSQQFQPSGNLACLARTTEARPAVVITVLEGEQVAESDLEEGAEIPLEGSGGLCRFAGVFHWAGAGVETALGGGSIRIRLI